MSATPVFSVDETLLFSGENDVFYNADHLPEMEIARGAFALTFVADDVVGRKALFSKDGAGYDDGGHITAWLEDGALRIRQQTDDESETLQTHHMTIAPGQAYHLVVSFGPGGLKIYLDGGLVLAEPLMRQGLTENGRELLIGASGHNRVDDGAFPSDPFKGEIRDFQLYDRPLSTNRIVELAGEALGSAAGDAAQDALELEALVPAFTQLHHGSDAARELAEEFGLMGGHHGGQGGEMGGGMAAMADDAHHDHSLDGVLAKIKSLLSGGDGDDVISGGLSDDLINGGDGDDTLSGGGQRDILQGGYGDDMLFGGGGRDVLDGGHGEDVLDGGHGDDLLITRADGREPYVYEDPDRDEGDPFNELTDGKLYPDQPIPADDILTGGAGADVFYVQTLINAKQRFIKEHTNDDGTIRWHGVAGENDNIHDHWVDEIGRDVITDFSFEEGDRILIEGHTTEILDITYGDADGDGAADHSNVWIYSQQGAGGGAHDEDRLGVLTVFGDLVTEADIEADAGPAYGIVRAIDALSEAVEPTDVSDGAGPATAPSVTADDGPASPFVYFLYDAETDEMLAQIQSGDIVDIDLVAGRDVTFSVAPVGFEAGSMRLRMGEHAKLENSAPFALFGGNGQDFGGGETFGLGDVVLHVEAYAEDGGNGALLAFDALSFSIVADAPSLIVEAEGDVAPTNDDDDDGPTANDREAMIGTDGDDVLTGAKGAERIQGRDGDDLLRGGAGEDLLNGGAGEDVLRGGRDDDVLKGGAHDDRALGNAGDDAIDGGGGGDVVKGGGGDDLLDGGTGDDMLVGGRGVDVFTFGLNGGHDVVRDFSDGEDMVDLSAHGLASVDALLLRVSQTPDGALIALSEEESLLLRNIDASALDASDFIL